MPKPGSSSIDERAIVRLRSLLEASERVVRKQRKDIDRLIAVEAAYDEREDALLERVRQLEAQLRDAGKEIL